MSNKGGPSIPCLETNCVFVPFCQCTHTPPLRSNSVDLSSLVQRRALTVVVKRGSCVCWDGHGGVFAFINEVSLSARACRCLVVYLQYIIGDGWVMEKPFPFHSKHYNISEKSQAICSLAFNDRLPPR